MKKHLKFTCKLTDSGPVQEGKHNVLSAQSISTRLLHWMPFSVFKLSWATALFEGQHYKQSWFGDTLAEVQRFLTVLPLL